MHKVKSVVMLGAGRLAGHLAQRLPECGVEIRQVYTRSIEQAQKLAEGIGADYTTKTAEIDETADALIFCLPDEAIKLLLEDMAVRKQVLIHTAGSVPIKVFDGYAEHFGVLYPLQSFSKDRIPEWEEIPLCIEGNNQQSQQMIQELAGRISGKVEILDSEQRKMLHLTAVIASNFSNHMYSRAFELARSFGLNEELLVPLIRETMEKAMVLGPVKAQTGPAIRGDRSTMEEHIALLKDKPEIQKLYTFISDSISNQNK